MRVFRIDIDADHALFLGKREGGFDGIVEQVAQNRAQVDLGNRQREGHMRVDGDGDALRAGQRNLAAQNRVRHAIPGFDGRGEPGEVAVQLGKVLADGGEIALFGVGA